jgi:hypothetical protein
MIIKYYIGYTDDANRDHLVVNSMCQIHSFSTQADANKEAAQLLLKTPTYKYYIMKKIGELYNGLIHDEIRERDTVMR